MNIQNNFIKFYIKTHSSRIFLGRPLMHFSRFECFKFSEFWNLPIYPDLTNVNLNSCRNRLRLQLIPYLKFFFNFNLNQKIHQIQTLINLENQYFDTLTHKIFFYHNIPKIFKYRMLHTFFCFIKKHISFFEIQNFSNNYK